MGCADWGETVALYDERNGPGSAPVASGALLEIARQVLAMSPAIRAHFQIDSPMLGRIGEWEIAALAVLPGFIEAAAPFRAAA